MDDARRAPLAMALPAAAALLIGECTAAGHPTQSGQVRVRFSEAYGVVRELWMPALQGLAVSVYDQVLIGRPGNSDEPVLLGVVDGATSRPTAPKPSAWALELLPDETVTVVDTSGTPLVEITQGNAGPTLRVLAPQVSINLAGPRRPSAESIERSAIGGSAKALPPEHGMVGGEKVRLN
jgi:hypothetical protein